MQSISISTLALITAFLGASAAHAQEDWKAPVEAAAKTSPITTSDASIELGRAAYERTCMGCHGKTGAGDGFAASMLKRKPKNLAEVLGKQSDGEVFWKARNGNAFMPSSASALSEEETWHVINFIRTLEAAKPSTHPWAAFPEGAWVEVHTDHDMVMGEGAEPMAWGSDSRMTVGASTADAITIEHDNPGRKILEHASVAIPAVDAIPGVRALGQWPHDIFPFGPEREAGVTSSDKQPTPQGVKTKTLREEQILVDEKPKLAKVIERKWKTTVADTTRDHVLMAWVVEGIELPVKWTLHVGMRLLSASELVSSEEIVKVGEISIPCMVTLTRKHLSDGVIIKRRWSSNQVPGFLVKMESEMKTDEYSLTVNEYVTAFQTTAVAVDKHAAGEGNPPGARPAFGFRPDTQSTENGVLVVRVTDGGPAANGGLEAGDLIVEIDGHAVLGLEDYMNVMSKLLIGKEVSVKVDRSGKRKDLRIVVGER